MKNFSSFCIKVFAILLIVIVFIPDNYAQILNYAESTMFLVPIGNNGIPVLNNGITNPTLYAPYANPLYSNINITQHPAPQNEPAVKINRKYQNVVLAAYRDFRYGVEPSAMRRVGYSYSTDMGLTWSVSTLLDSTLIPDEPRNSDPVIGCDSAGNFYIGVIALNTINTNGYLLVYKSTDKGVTFPFAYTVASSSGTGEDKEYIANDLVQGSPYYNSIYFSWTRILGSTSARVMCTKSTNGGVNWTTPVAVSDLSSGVQGSQPVISTNGQVNILWVKNNGTDATNTVNAMNKSATGDFKVMIDPKTNKLSCTGTGKTKMEGLIKFAIENENVKVNLITTRDNKYNGEYFATGMYYGSKTIDGVENTYQIFNIKHAEKYEEAGGSSVGESAMHEIGESFMGGMIFENPGTGYNSDRRDKLHSFIESDIEEEQYYPKQDQEGNIYGYYDEKNNFIPLYDFKTGKTVYQIKK